MAKETFQLGANEKHVLLVDVSIFWKRVKIEVDSKTIVDESHFTPGPSQYKFDIGATEKHKVEVSAGGFSPIKVYVDGKEIQKAGG